MWSLLRADVDWMTLLLRLPLGVVAALGVSLDLPWPGAGSGTFFFKVLSFASLLRGLRSSPAGSLLGLLVGVVLKWISG